MLGVFRSGKIAEPASRDTRTFCARGALRAAIFGEIGSVRRDAKPPGARARHCGSAGGRAEPFEAFGARIVRLVEHLRAVDHRFCGAARKRLDFNLSAMLRLVALRYT